jgi:hypothetical protein
MCRFDRNALIAQFTKALGGHPVPKITSKVESFCAAPMWWCPTATGYFSLEVVPGFSTETIKELWRWKVMVRSFTSTDLRRAARQAMTLAYMDFRRDTRETLLRTADRLLAEADDAEKADLELTSSPSDKGAKIIDLMEALQSRRS